MIYVDPIQKYFKVAPAAQNYGNLWCHMTADSIEELHTFATTLGLKRSWYQPGSNSMPHYDLTPAMRAKAVELGAQEETPMELGKRLVALRQARKAME